MGLQFCPCSLIKCAVFVLVDAFAVLVRAIEVLVNVFAVLVRAIEVLVNVFAVLQKFVSSPFFMNEQARPLQ